MVATGIVLGAVALGATFVPRAVGRVDRGRAGRLAGGVSLGARLCGLEPALVNAVLVAAVILVLALWVLVTDKDYLGTPIDRPAH
jgi:hypothetical protein